MDVNNSQDVIDSRDVERRIDELEALDDARNEEDAAELKALLALREEAKGYSPDWEYGATLVRESYFEDYAQQLAEDCDMLPKDAKWPLTCIDWAQAARELKQDYTVVDFDGVEYLVQ